MLAKILLIALGWTWIAVPEATHYEVWCAKWGETWGYCGATADETIRDDEFFNEPIPGAGELVCITIRAANDDGVSELGACCGPCEEVP
jgi:hypothetical protein